MWVNSFSKTSSRIRNSSASWPRLSFALRARSGQQRSLFCQGKNTDDVTRWLRLIFILYLYIIFTYIIFIYIIFTYYIFLDFERSKHNFIWITIQMNTNQTKLQLGLNQIWRRLRLSYSFFLVNFDLISRGSVGQSAKPKQTLTLAYSNDNCGVARNLFYCLYFYSEKYNTISLGWNLTFKSLAFFSKKAIYKLW
jgi:hypothetical protein